MTTDRQLSEQAASGIVGAGLGVVVRELDGPGAVPGTPDFEIILNDGPVPLEVTRSTDGDHRSFWKATSNTDWALDGLAHSWWISTGYAYPVVKELRGRLAEVLPQLEAVGITEFDTDQPDAHGNRPDPGAPWFPLVEVGVRRGRVIAMEQNPALVVLGNSGGFVTGPEVVNDLVKQEYKSNATKVGERGHLFVWVDSLSHHAWSAMDLDGPPRTGPRVPDGVTAWVARQTRTGEWTADRLWRARGGEWESLTSSLE